MIPLRHRQTMPSLWPFHAARTRQMLMACLARRRSHTGDLIKGGKQLVRDVVADVADATMPVIFKVPGHARSDNPWTARSTAH